MKQTNLTSPTKQNEFLKLVQTTETEIKKTVVYFSLNMLSRQKLIKDIKGKVQDLDKQLPMDLIEREGYINGLYRTALFFISAFYDKVIQNFLMMERPKGILKPLDIVQKPKEMTINAWQEAKATPNVKDYYKKLKMRVRELGNATTSTNVVGKRQISAWQKAEIDLRYEGQMEMINDLKTRNVRYAFISTHPDCSKRCSHFQGKLMDLDSLTSEMSGFRMKNKVDGHTVYCFNEIINQVDKYGYKNNIVVGFNCRHKLVEYKAGMVAPTEYNEKIVKKNRDINSNLRAMEREIRKLKTDAILFNVIDPKISSKLNSKIRELTAKYKNYATKNGFAWYPDRIKVI